MKKNITKYGILFILPYFILYILFNLYPILYTLKISLTKYDGFSDPVFIGLKNYMNLVVDKAFWSAFLNTWSIWLPNIIMQLALAMLIAVLFTDVRIKLKGVNFFRAVFYFPNLVTAASIALLVTVMLDWQNGVVNQLVFGSDKEKYIYWLVSPRRAQFVISIIQTWMWFGHSMIILVAGLKSIPRSYYEAAEVDGANVLGRFAYVTFPLIMPIFIYIVITSLIGGMQIFDVPYVISNGPQVLGQGTHEKALHTMVVYMYNAAFKYNRIGYGASISYFLFAIIVGFSLIYMKILTVGRKEKNE